MLLKQLNKIMLPLMLLQVIACESQSITVEKREQLMVPQKEIKVNSFTTSPTIEIDKNIRSIFQDSKGNYWFGTNSVGIFRYDGKEVIQYTTKDGLSNNQVLTIQEDTSGKIWLGTGLFGVSCFDGQTFTTHTNKANLKTSNKIKTDWIIEPNDLWFYAGGGAYRFEKIMTYLPFQEPNSNNFESENTPFKLSRQAVYCLLKDRKSNLWFGTQAEGVCRFDGKTFTWFTEKGLLGPAVLAVFEDGKGNLWFGNNGGGLFKYDGKTLINFTEEKGLGNKDFLASSQSNSGTLARIYSINEDSQGNLWIGTVDSGVWKYDGKNLTNFTTKDGLCSNAINCIYKDQKNELWFGTDEDGICKFNGTTFEKFEIK